MIWIVEDSPDEPMLVERLLGAAYDFQRFASGAVVVERLAAGEHQPDLVLLDRVGVASGLAAGDDVCRILRSHPRTHELPIILITASRIEPSDVADAFASGANDYVARPFATEELRARVDSAIRVKRLRDLAMEKDRRLAATELAINAERERIARFQQEMFSIVGHDLRAPLEAILIGTETLASDLADLPASAYVVRRIKSSAKRMTRMVEQLLDVTRARLGTGIAVARHRTRLLPLIKSVMDELSVTQRESQFELVAVADVVGLWDSDRLGQVMSNLLSNAMHYGLEGGRIIVEVNGHDGGATIAVHNELRDSPIPADALATLFDPYRRGNHPHNARGLGLGLYIVNEIVHAHGGTIDVESVPSGTTFRVVLPTPGEGLAQRAS